MDDSLMASQEGLKIVKDAGRKKGWNQTATPEWWRRANTTQATLKRFWQGRRIDGSAFRGICEAVGVNWKQVAELSQSQETELPVVFAPKATPSLPNLNFVGREGAIADLNTRVNQGAKIIVIQAPGGVGKTTLAQEYLNSQGFDVVLELLMAKEKENITPVESVIEEWLQRDFQEEPGGNFGVTLGRLKRQLQTRWVGVLIDNLEPALDGQGRFIEPHRRYVELLRILADSSVQSITLITSREPLAECLGITNYSLPSLDERAWQDFFSCRDIDIDETTLKEMHKAYGGNALAMTILCDPIQRDGGMVAYWRDHKVEADLLVELAVENLVKEQFNRLEKIYPEAYRLLCRLGCYRYQDVPTVPSEGLLCLLWDVPETQQRRVIESLRNRSLVECYKGEYWLHPVVRTEALARLRASKDWEKANRTAAEFWTTSVNSVETLENALTALESYYHYIAIGDFELAGYVFIKKRTNKWVDQASLGVSLYRLGLLQQAISVINSIVDKISINYSLCKIYNILGDLYWLTGLVHKAIECHKKSGEIADIFLKKLPDCNEEVQVLDFANLKLWSLINVGLCKIDFGEFEEALTLFQEAILFGENIDGNKELLFLNNVFFCLAFLYSVLGLHQQASTFAEKVIFSEVKESEWSRGYKYIFLGLAYKNMRRSEKAFETYQQAIAYAKESRYTQLEAKALTVMAELYREQGDLQIAIEKHLKSIDILKKIGAKCDLAEAYYQLGLTYQKRGKTTESQESFNKAIVLFTEMEAPKQIEKVRQAAGLAKV